MESPNFTCEICDKAFSTNKYKDQHISTVHGEDKNFKCNVCYKTFGLKQELIIHIENNHQVKDQKCKFCAKSFVNFGRLSKHITNIHKSERKYKCDSCQRVPIHIQIQM